jgi:hypothetical protein
VPRACRVEDATPRTWAPTTAFIARKEAHTR